MICFNYSPVLDIMFLKICVFWLLYTIHSNGHVSLSLPSSSALAIRLNPRRRLDRLKDTRHFKLDLYYQIVL